MKLKDRASCFFSFFLRSLIWIREQVGEKRSTVCTHRYADCLLKKTSTKENKYVVNEKLEDIGGKTEHKQTNKNMYIKNCQNSLLGKRPHRESFIRIYITSKVSKEWLFMVRMSYSWYNSSSCGIPSFHPMPPFTYSAYRLSNTADCMLITINKSVYTVTTTSYLSQINVLKTIWGCLFWEQPTYCKQA